MNLRNNTFTTRASQQDGTLYGNSRTPIAANDFLDEFLEPRRGIRCHMDRFEKLLQIARDQFSAFRVRRRAGVLKPATSFRWMLAYGQQKAAEVAEVSAVEMKSLHGGASDLGEADDFEEIFRPLEVRLPAILPGVKQPHIVTRERIGGAEAVGFVCVATRAGLGEIPCLRSAATPGWNDVLDAE